MMDALVLAIFVSAALSLLSYAYCWHDIRMGRPHIISLRQITGIMDRNRLNALFGKPEPGYYYKLSPTQLYGLIRKRRWFYITECTADSTCILGAWMAITGGMVEENIGFFIILAGTCQGINLIYSIWVVRKWHSQLREEIEQSDD